MESLPTTIGIEQMRALPQQKFVHSQWSEMRLITKLANNMNDKICIEDGMMCPFFRVQTINPIEFFQTGESCQHN